MSRYDERTALVVVDLQNDFADRAGRLTVIGGEEIIPVINDAVRQAQDAGAFVVVTQDWHPDSTPHFAKDGGIWPVHCVAGTWGAEFHPDLTVNGTVVRKGANGEDGYSGFTMRDPVDAREVPTELQGLLKDSGVESLVVAGLALDYCVKATAVDAAALGYRTVVPLRLTAAVELEAGDGEAAAADIRSSGAEVI